MTASAYATFEREAPRACVPPPPHVAEVRAAIRAGKFSTELVDVWARMGMTWRVVAVMIGCTQPGKPEDIAKQPWDSFSPADQLEMASAVRDMRAGTAEFAAVA